MSSLIPFSLVCNYCDDGQHLHSRLQAEAEGWTDIEEATDLPQANYIGVCPVCKAAIEAMDSARDEMLSALQKVQP